MRVFSYEELEEAPLIIDAIYKGGSEGNVKDDPLTKLLPRTSNQGGFRITHRVDDMTKPAYVVIYTSFMELEWPDFLDAEKGVFRYYGDNRKPGRGLHETWKKGNLLLKTVFTWLNENGDSLKEIPPFLIFKKAGEGRDVQFLGLAAPGNNNLPPDRELIAFWRTNKQQRFQNYEAYFTILDSGDEEISKEWLNTLVFEHEKNINYAPRCWRYFVEMGRLGAKALKAPKVTMIRNKVEQIPSTEEGRKLVQIIHKYYVDNPYGFEKCALSIICLMDKNFVDFDLTRPWRDGGRDALGKYRIGLESNYLHVECALEAKCYALNNSVGVRQMSRLISRIKYRQFGIMVTTSYVHEQAYKEVIEDEHPILIISGKDIADILRNNGIDCQTVGEWLKSIC
ncbi:restriction endonuclease [Dorea sp. D27]|uniref:restriction endonuclease n=1 Tax=Dorea sp. D27 TaxID=658665 RepID=UPI000673ABAB|nr:restriction endonuclease [Dorea sp. D27]